MVRRIAWASAIGGVVILAAITVGLFSPESRIRIPAITAHRILLRDGVPVAALKAGQTIALERNAWESDDALERALRVGRMPPELRPYYS